MSWSTDIRGELRSILLRVPGLPAVAWENRDFTPTPRTPWVRERLAWLPAELVTTGGEQGTVSERGLYLVDPYFSRDASTSALDQMADAIRSAFKPGTRLGCLLGGYVQSAARAAYLTEPDWVMSPVTIRFYCYRQNT